MKKYDKYKDSGIEWIGEIPEHWEAVPMRFLLRQRIADGPHETPKFISEGVPFLSVDGIQNGELVFEGCRKISHEDHKTYKQKCIVEKYDILMGKAASVGKVAQVKVDFEFSIWSPLALLKPNLDKIISSYFEYFLKSTYAKDNANILSTFNTQQNISMTDIPRIYFILPPTLKEQTAIANYLDRKTAEIDELIADKKRLLELYKEEKTAIINQAVTSRDRVCRDRACPVSTNVKTKDSGIEWLGEIPEHWEVKRLKYVAKINPSKNYKYKNSIDEVVFLPMEKVGEDGSYSCDINKPVSELWNGFTYFERNDIIVAKITPCFENGKGALLVSLDSEIGFGSTEFHVIRAKDVLPKYLYYITRSEFFMKSGEAFMTGAAGQKRVPTNFISEFELCFPNSLAEQQSIVHYIETECSRIDTKISRTEKLIALLTEYRTALISEVVTGKIKVVE